MDPYNLQSPKPKFKITGEKVAFMLGGTLIGALAIIFTLKLATPIVKKACQSLLTAPDIANREARVVSVEASVLKPGVISKRITTIGKLRANEYVTLHTEMQGRIKEIDFKEGTMVKKGDVLIRFEDDELQAEVDKAEADVEYRQVKFSRMQKPELKGFTRAHEYDQERGNLNIAKAALELAKAKLAKATITAPFDGKIGLINVSVGSFVDTQKELVTIVDFDPMKIDFKIPEIHIHDIGVGQTAEVKLDSFPDRVFKASVEAIDSRVDPQTHSIAVRATIPNEDGKLQTGLFGSVSVIIGVKNDALIVPDSAIGREGDIEYVWVITNGKAGRKRVLTGTKETGHVEITAGLREGEIVVTSGQLKLGEGSAVKISNMESADVELTDEEDSSQAPKEASASNSETKSSSAETTPKGIELAAQEPPKPTKEATETQTSPSASNEASASNSEAKPSPAETTPKGIEPAAQETPKPTNLVGPNAQDSLEKSPQSSQESQKNESSDSPKSKVEAHPLQDEKKPVEQVSNQPINVSNNTSSEPLAGKPAAPESVKMDTPSVLTGESIKTNEAAPQTTELQKAEPQKQDIAPGLDVAAEPSKLAENNTTSRSEDVNLQKEPVEIPLTTEAKSSFFTSMYTKTRDFVINLFRRN